jgi:molybdopterin-guanine dinucleotide biosynthesis protein B
MIMVDNPPLIAIIGRSKTGKTTLIEKLIEVFKYQGYRIGTVKHHLADFEFDLKGKDSWRHRQAGAEVVIMSSPTQLAFIEKRKQELSLAEIQRLFENKVDLILAEGFKKSRYPKIEVYRKKEGENGPLAKKIEGVIAVVTDENINCALPLFRWSEIERLAEFIKERLNLK